MEPTTRKHLRVLCLLSAAVLALSLFLPWSVHTTYLTADGRPAGFLGQLLAGPDTPSVRTAEFVWEDAEVLIYGVFFLPAALALLLGVRRAPIRLATTYLAPVVACGLLVILVALVELADFGLWTERTYGGYVALTAMTCFLLASGALALGDGLRRFRRGPGTARFGQGHSGGTARSIS